jgi:hypothetical protein
MDLGQRIAATVRGYLVDNPGTANTDVIQAFRVARELLRTELGQAHSRTVIVLLATITGLGLFASLALLFLDGELSSRIPAIAVAVVVLAVAAMIAAVVRRS